MELQYTQECKYVFIEGSKIQTQSSTLYKAYDCKRNNRIVAVKCVKINPRFSRQELAKAQGEVIAMLAIREKCENIPLIYDYYYDEKSHILYIIMEWVDGKDLGHYMSKNLVGEREFIGWMKKLCDILTEMERKRMYHKDIKPTNIMIDDNKKFYLIDFNISLSKTNLIEGTPIYQAPEAGINSNYTGREKVDMYAMGVIMYEYYLGRFPQAGKEYYASINDTKTWSKFVEPINNTELVKKISPQMSDIITRCMKYFPTDRYSNYRELKAALNQVERKK